MGGATVRAAFAVMTEGTTDPPAREVSAPPSSDPNLAKPGTGPMPMAPTQPDVREVRGDAPPPDSNRGLKLPSPFAPMPVQTIALTPLAQLDAVPMPPISRPDPAQASAAPASQPERTTKLGLAPIVLVVAFLLLVLAAIAVMLLRR